MTIVWVYLAALAAGSASANDATAIMIKVAANTAAATDGRLHYVYHQKIRTSLIRTDGKMARREIREYSVIPQKATTDKTLTAFSGEYLQGKRMISYAAPAAKSWLPAILAKWEPTIAIS